MVGLDIEPHLGRPAEIALKPQGCIHGKGAFALHDLFDAAWRDTNVLGNPVFRESQWNQEILAENFAGMDGSVCFRGEA